MAAGRSEQQRKCPAAVPRWWLRSSTTATTTTIVSHSHNINNYNYNYNSINFTGVHL